MYKIVKYLKAFLVEFNRNKQRQKRNTIDVYVHSEYGVPHCSNDFAGVIMLSEIKFQI